MALVPLKLLAVAVSGLFAFGFAIDGQRLEDRTSVFEIDHEMDARLTAYVPLVRDGVLHNDLSPDGLLTLAGRWRSGRISGELRAPMPARYGDNDGARRELFTEAMRLSGELTYIARRERDRSRALALFTAAIEPLRCIQYSDMGALRKIEWRRVFVARAMTESHFSPFEISSTTEILKPNREKTVETMRHMDRLRNQFRAHFDDDESLWEADPYFEALVQSAETKRLLARG